MHPCPLAMHPAWAQPGRHAQLAPALLWLPEPTGFSPVPPCRSTPGPPCPRGLENNPPKNASLQTSRPQPARPATPRERNTQP